MEFCIRKWLMFYNKSKIYSQEIKYLSKRHSSKHYTKTDEFKEVSNSLIKHHAQVSKYLDACKLKMNSPAWVYSADNPNTHYSNENFTYKHLVNPEFEHKYKIYEYNNNMISNI